PALPQYRPVQPQRLRLRPAGLLQPRAELRPDPGTALDEPPRPAAGDRVPLSLPRRPRHPRPAAPALGRPDLARTRARDRRRADWREPPRGRPRHVPLFRLPPVQPQLERACARVLAQRPALDRGREQQRRGGLGLLAAEHGRAPWPRPLLERADRGRLPAP